MGSTIEPRNGSWSAQEHGQETLGEHSVLESAQLQVIVELRRGLASREVIGKAVGLLMSRYDLDEDSAYALLVRKASVQDERVRDIAAALVEDANRNGRRIPSSED